nr:MAG TPA: hypothetical protein [Caudoviricetes sp.]
MPCMLCGAPPQVISCAYFENVISVRINVVPYIEKFFFHLLLPAGRGDCSPLFRPLFRQCYLIGLAAVVKSDLPFRVDNRKVIIAAYRSPQYFHKFPLVRVLLFFSCFQIVNRRLFRADAAILLACSGLFLTLRERVATCVYNAVAPNYVFGLILGTVQLFHEKCNTFVGGHAITLSNVWGVGRVSRPGRFTYSPCMP